MFQCKGYGEEHWNFSTGSGGLSGSLGTTPSLQCYPSSRKNCTSLSLSNPCVRKVSKVLVVLSSSSWEISTTAESYSYFVESSFTCDANMSSSVTSSSSIFEAVTSGLSEELLILLRAASTIDCPSLNVRWALQCLILPHLKQGDLNSF